MAAAGGVSPPAAAGLDLGLELFTRHLFPQLYLEDLHALRNVSKLLRAAVNALNADVRVKVAG